MIFLYWEGGSADEFFSKMVARDRSSRFPTVTTMRALIFGMALFAFGCTRSGLGLEGDASINADAAADLQSASCGQIHDSVGAWLDTHRSCVTSEDCAIVNTTCGLVAECGEYYSSSANSPYLSSLVDGWLQQGCEPLPCHDCPIAHPPAACVAGQCMAAMQ